MEEHNYDSRPVAIRMEEKCDRRPIYIQRWEAMIKAIKLACEAVEATDKSTLEESSNKTKSVAQAYKEAVYFEPDGHDWAMAVTYVRPDIPLALAEHFGIWAIWLS